MIVGPIGIPYALLDAQEQGELVIFAGASVSMSQPSGLPNFVGLARKIAGSHDRVAGPDDNRVAQPTP